MMSNFFLRMTGSQLLTFPLVCSEYIESQVGQKLGVLACLVCRLISGGYIGGGVCYSLIW